jgi:pyruvate dehydrogenase E1 component beta subunit
MARLNMVEALNQAFHQEMAANPRIVTLGEDVGANGGVFRVTDGLQARYPGRVFDTPLSENGIAATSVGMAVYGLHPVAEIQFNGFVYYAINQLINQATRIRMRSRGRFSAPLTLRVPWSGGFKALEHHGDSMEALFVHMPGMTVLMPSTPADAKGLLIAAMRHPDPVLFCEPIKLYRAIREEVPDEPYATPIGKAKLLREGTDVTIITWGTMVVPSLQAAQQAGQAGTNCEVIDLRSLSPFDEPAILASVRKTGRLVIVHEAPRTCGLGAEVAARVAEKALDALEAPIVRVTGHDTPMPLLKSEDYYIPDARRVLRGIEKVAAY